MFNFIVKSLMSISILSLANVTMGSTKIEFKPDVSFIVETSIPAVNVEGELKGASTFEAEVLQEESKKVLKNVIVRIPVSSLSTGMGVRDNHMYEKIFKGKDKVIEFLSEGFCSLQESKCKLPGTLTISGNPSKVTLELDDMQYKDDKVSAKSEMNVLLDDFKIEAPEYMGVSVEKKVNLKINVVQK